VQTLDVLAYAVLSIFWLFIVCPVIGGLFGDRFIGYINALLLGARIQIDVCLIVLIIYASYLACIRVF